MKKNFVNDYVKACRRAEREEEIEMYGKQIFAKTKIKETKRKYNRKKAKNIYDE